MSKKTIEPTETGKKSHQDKYVCDACLIHFYKQDKWEYLESITNESWRRIMIILSQYSLNLFFMY